MMLIPRFSLLATMVFLVACNGQHTLPTDGSIPAWLRQLVSKGGHSRPIIEKATYNGQPAFELIATDRADTGDEHVLYSAKGDFICQFGGFVGQVTAGSCELNKIIYVSTLYDPRKP